MRTTFFLYVLIINMICANFDHNHNQNNEFGIAIGIVPGHDDEDDNLGLHLHYIRGFGEHNQFGIGLSLETIFDKHEHNSISLIGAYHFHNGFTIAYAPGILFEEHEGNTEIEITQHFEFYYEFEVQTDMDVEMKYVNN